MGLIKNFFKNLTEDHDVIKRDKGDYIELLEINETLFAFNTKRVRIPKGSMNQIEPIDVKLLN